MDDKSNTGNLDRLLISLAEDYEIRDWSKRFGCTPQQLVNAVKAVGNSAKAVQAYLAKSRQSSTT